MSKKIKINIPGFGNRYCSDDVEYKVFNYKNYGEYYIFLKKGKHIFHNEYGPSYEDKDGNYQYLINDKFHRTNGPAIFNKERNITEYWFNGSFIGYSERSFKKFIDENNIKLKTENTFKLNKIYNLVLLFLIGILFFLIGVLLIKFLNPTPLVIAIFCISWLTGHTILFIGGLYIINYYIKN